MISPEEAIEAISARFGVHSGRRALHARGVVCAGTFVASPEAGALTTAPHMQGERIGVVARFSNGGGDPEEPDRAPDVRGLAVRFELPGGGKTDIVAQNAPRFPVASPDAFIAMIQATERGRGMLAKLPLFLARNPGAIPALRANAAALRAPRSYADPTYHAVHAFRWRAPDGSTRWVRYTFVPVSGDVAGEQDRGVTDYLTRELAGRLAGGGTVGFDLELEVAGDGDDPHDPSSVWKRSERVIAGRLEVESILDGRESTIFDPMRLTDGIEPSEDPVLHFRPKAYGVSYARRTGDATAPPPWAR
jgi:catalase